MALKRVGNELVCDKCGRDWGAEFRAFELPKQCPCGDRFFSPRPAGVPVRHITPSEVAELGIEVITRPHGTGDFLQPARSHCYFVRPDETRVLYYRTASDFSSSAEWIVPGTLRAEKTSSVYLEKLPWRN